MNAIIVIVKFALKCLLAAVLGTIAGFFAEVLIEPLVIPGDNPHIDAYGKLGLAMVCSSAGALIGVLAVIVLAIRNKKKTQPINPENPE